MKVENAIFICFGIKYTIEKRGPTMQNPTLIQLFDQIKSRNPYETNSTMLLKKSFTAWSPYLKSNQNG